MTHLIHRDRRIETDAEGFLRDPDDWSPELAPVLAAGERVPELQDDHWRVIDVLREQWRRRGVAPAVRVLCRETGLSLGRIYDLFPSGPLRGACKAAGLPKPDSCV